MHAAPRNIGTFCRLWPVKNSMIWWQNCAWLVTTVSLYL